jgi:hypothetical protein
MRLLVALLAPSLLLATAACAADWEKVAEIDGILIEVPTICILLDAR